MTHAIYRAINVLMRTYSSKLQNLPNSAFIWSYSCSEHRVYIYIILVIAYYIVNISNIIRKVYIRKMPCYNAKSISFRASMWNIDIKSCLYIDSSVYMIEKKEFIRYVERNNTYSNRAGKWRQKLIPCRVSRWFSIVWIIYQKYV